MPGRNPWGWMTDERVTLALKLLMVLVLAAYLGHYLIDFFARIRGIVYILIGAVFFAYLIYPAVHWLSRWMKRIFAILIVYAGILRSWRRPGSSSCRAWSTTWPRSCAKRPRSSRRSTPA